jgi:hypothetical protein
MPGPGPNGPSGSSGRITIDITANRAAASIVGSSSRATSPCSRGFSASSNTVIVVSAADKRKLSQAGEDAGADHDERRDFRGRIDVVLAGTEVTRRRQAPARRRRAAPQ